MTYCSVALHRHTPAEIIALAESECLRRNVRLTEQRRRVLELIAASEKPIKAYDLLEKLKGRYAGAAPPTVYRALDFLMAEGFVHRLETMNAFLSCPHPTRTHPTQFLICKDCGVVQELEDKELAARLFERVREQGFVPAQQVVEVLGRCARCVEAP
jgi:Fur family zinc uptake transcriptional regulator